MYPVTQNFLTQVRADSRRIDGRVEIYYSSAPTQFYSDTIVSIALTEEVSAPSAIPLGAVSSNELVVTLSNEDNMFSPSNVNSPFAIRKGLQILAYLGIADEWVPLGTFKIYDYELSEDTLSIRLTCYDRIYELGNLDTPVLPILENTSVGHLFESLFYTLGLESSDFIIDPEVYQNNIKIGWVEGEKVRDALQFLAVAGMCNVFVDRLNRIRVTNIFRGGAPVDEWDDNQIFNIYAPRTTTNAYSDICITCNDCTVADSVEAARITRTLYTGLNSIKSIRFDKPLGVVEAVILENTRGSYISSVNVGAKKVDLEIFNTGEAETADIVIVGRPLEITKNDIAIADEKTGILSIDNVLIQDPEYSKTYAQLVRPYLQKTLIGVKARGNPAVELCDCIKVTSSTLGVGNYLVMRQVINYDGALEVEATLGEITIPVQYVFVTPNLLVETKFRTAVQ